MRENQLYRPIFIASVFLLLLNDFFLKYEFHNYLTGKLSDFAGLFAFPYFFSCFFPKRTKQIYLFTVVFFVFWKSSFSQSIFNVVQDYGLGFDRVVDYSDLLALLILPLSYRYWKMDTKVVLNLKRIFKPIIVTICCFAFVATSQPRKRVRYDYISDFEMVVPIALDSAINKLNLYGYYSENKFLYAFELDERRTDIVTKVTLEQLQDDQLKIKLDSIIRFNIDHNSNTIWFTTYDKEDLKYAKNLSLPEIEQLFEERIKAQLKK